MHHLHKYRTIQQNKPLTYIIRTTTGAEKDDVVILIQETFAY